MINYFKLIIIGLLQICACGAGLHTHPLGNVMINDQYYIDFLNKDNSNWVAGVNERFSNVTYDQARNLLGTYLYPNNVTEQITNDLYYTSKDIPIEFSVLEKWKGKIKPIRDQQHCGSCWAFSASEVLSDRFAISTNNENSPVLSPEDLVSCDKGDDGCKGGQLPTAWKYLTGTGIVTDKCFPYEAGNGKPPMCPKKCVDGTGWDPYKAKSSYAIRGVENIQQELMLNGPIQVAFMVYKSFMSYKSGVYKKKWYEFIPEGGHAVKLVGWGEENGIKYWLVANSWNTTWGLDGYFKILRGTDECGIETSGPPYAGIPMLTNAYYE